MYKCKEIDVFISMKLLELISVEESSRMDVHNGVTRSITIYLILNFQKWFECRITTLNVI